MNGDSIPLQNKHVRWNDAMPSDLEHLPIHSKEEAARNFNILYMIIASRAKKLASEDMATFAFRDANRALRNLQSGTAGERALLKFQQSQRIIEHRTGRRAPTENYRTGRRAPNYNL
jgi:hypothetical protein